MRYSGKPMLPDPGDYDSSWKKLDQKVYWSKVRRHNNSFQYVEKCLKCGKEIVIQTQEDNNSEYYARVYVKCDCGEFAEFILPVN